MTWRRGRSRPRPGWHAFDVRDSAASEAALRAVLPRATSLTLYLCWHAGEGHSYPAHVTQAARRLRERQTENSSSDDAYTSLTFTPSAKDLEDIIAVAPYCDLAFAMDDSDEVIWEVSGEGESGSVREPMPRGPALSKDEPPGDEDDAYRSELRIYSDDGRVEHFVGRDDGSG